MQRYLEVIAVVVLFLGAGCGGEECVEGDGLCESIGSSQHEITPGLVPPVVKEPISGWTDVPNGMSGRCDDLRALCGGCQGAMDAFVAHAFADPSAVGWASKLITLMSTASQKCEAFEACKTDCGGCTASMIGCVLSFGVGCVAGVLSSCMGCDFGQPDVDLGSCYPPGSIPTSGSSSGTGGTITVPNPKLPPAPTSPVPMN